MKSAISSVLAFAVVVFIVVDTRHLPSREKRSVEQPALARDSALNVKLPFADLINLPDIVGLFSGFAAANSNSTGTRLNLPFSDFRLPSLFPLSSASNPPLSGGFLPQLFARPLVGVNAPPVNLLAQRSNDSDAKEIDVVRQFDLNSRAAFESGAEAALGAAPKPWSMINLPLASFQLPFSEVSEDRLPLPESIKEKLDRLYGTEREDDENLIDTLRQWKKDTDNKNRTGDLERKPIIPDAVLRGNFNADPKILTRTLLRKSNKVFPGPNQMSLPLSVYEAPLSLVQLPLSAFRMPLSRFDSLPNENGRPVSVDGSGLLPAEREEFHRQQELEVARLLGLRDIETFDNGTSDNFTLTDAVNEQLPGGVPTPVNSLPGLTTLSPLQDDNGTAIPQTDCAPSDAICLINSAMTPDLPFDLNSFSLPYSFLNTPLSFFNLPLSYVNLPYGSSNMPFGHLSLPFSYHNLPLFEMMQTFGNTARSLKELAKNKDINGTLADGFTVDRINSSSILPNWRDLAMKKATNKELTESMVKIAEKNREAIQRFNGFLAKYNAAASAFMANENVTKFYKAATNSTDNSSTFASGLKRPGDALKLAFDIFKNFRKPDAINRGPPDLSQLAGLHNILRQATEVPGVPQLGGLFGTPLSLFPTPLSLFNLPTGFLDSPLGFMNLPLSHFNLPLSHLTLPFAGLTPPFGNMRSPELHQTVENATVELADIPPSLLEVANPQNYPLTSYVNSPLSEMNLPLAVMDMPFAVFDTPFAFLNMPMAHLNDPLTHLHLPFEISSLPFAELAQPFAGLIPPAEPPSPPLAGV